MSTGYSLCFHILRIILQILVFGYRDSHTVMVNSKFTPYVSEFEYASRFHPSKNPDCGTSWSENMAETEDEIDRQNFGRYGRSPEEGPSVGEEPSIELRAILVRCPMTDEETDDILVSRDIFNITAGRSQDILDFHGFDRDEPTRHSEVRDCRRKLVITMRFNNIGRTKTQEEFVVIDHVLDPVTMHKARLLNPLVVKVRQEPVLQLYGLKFQEVVNAEVKEEVINNKQSNFKGCDDTSGNPTCGQMFMEEQPVTYSRGFCCSCDPEVNIQRQILALNETVPPPVPSFFSRSKDRLVKPFKNIRSVGEMFFDPSDRYESSVLSSSRDVDENTLDSPKINSYYQKNLDPIESDSTLLENSYKDEKDLLNLKNFKTTDGSPRRTSASRSDKIVNENRIEARDSRTGGVVSTLIQNSSGTIDENPGNLPDARPDSQTSHKDEPPESRRKHGGKSSKRKSSINIIDELAKLEADYKNFRISSFMGDEGRRDRTDENVRRNVERATLEDTKYLDRGLDAGDVGNFRPIESLEKKLISKNEQDNGNYGPSSSSKGNIRVEGNIYHPESLNDVNSDLPLDSIDWPANPHHETTTTSIRETQTAAVLWQKLASDRVYPSGEKGNVNSRPTTTNDGLFHSPTKTTSSLDENIDHHAAHLHSNSAADDSAKSLSLENLSSSSNRSILRGKFDPPISQSSSIAIGKNGYDVRLTPEFTTAKDHRDWNDFTTSFNETFGRAANFTDSFSSFSGGNHTENDALTSSGSLRNQLGNWLTYDERKRYETEGDGESSKKNYGEKIKLRNNGGFEAMSFTSLLNATTKNYFLHDDRSSASDSISRPVEVYLGRRYDRKSFEGIDDASDFIKIRSKIENYSPRASRDSKRLNFPRSYRSIGKDDRFPSKSNYRNGNIDKRNKDDFEGIFDVLKDAGLGQKIVRGKPKSEETFERDNTVMEKFPSQVFNRITPVIVEGNGSIIYRNSVKSRQGLRQNYGDYPGISRKEKIRFINKEFKLRNINDVSQIEHNLHRNSDFEQVNRKFHDVEKSEDNRPVIEIAVYTEDPVKPVYETPQTTAYKVIIDRFTFVNEYRDMPENQGNSTGLANVSPKVRDLMVPTASFLEPPMIAKNESLVGSATEMSVAIKPRLFIDELKTFNDVHNDKQRSNPLVSYDHESEEELSKNEKKLSTNGSKADSSFEARLPLLTIENLKKELQNEAERYSPFFQFRSTAAGSSSEKVERYWKNVADVREINTVLTPAEKVEDLITDEETLPPDEETKHTTFPLPQTTNFSSSNATIPFVESEISNSTVFPRLAIRNFRETSPKIKMDIAFLSLDKSSLSSTRSLQPLESGSVREKGIHRRRHRRKNTANRKQFTKYKRSFKQNSIATKAEASLERRKARNSDDPRHEASIERGTISSKSQDEMTTTPLPSNASPISHSYKKRKHKYGETPQVFRSDLQNEHGVSNGNQHRTEPGKRYSSIGEISDNDFHSRIEAPLINNVSTSFEITRKKLENNTAETDSNHDFKTVHLPLKSMRKNIIYEGASSPSAGAVTYSILENLKGKAITERPQRYLQTSTSRKFPSFYPRSSEIIAASRNNDLIDNVANADDGTSKRDDVMELNENEGAAPIFHDYEDREGGSGDGKVNTDFKRSLDNAMPEEMIGSIEPADGWKEKMELLKLRKHADVLKEYLNWRQDVGPLQPLQLTGYTTRITMTKEAPDESVTFVTTTPSIEHRATSVSSAESTCSTIVETLPTPIVSATNTLESSCQQDDTTHVSIKSSTVESSSSTALTCDTTRNFDEPMTTNKVEIPTNCFLNSNDHNNTTTEKVFSQEEASTGKILPPCDSKIKFPLDANARSTAPTTLHILSEYFPDTSPGVISDHRSPCSDADNDLLVISILEKIQQGSQNIRGRIAGRDAVAKIYKIQDEGKPTTDSSSHRRMVRKKSSRRRVERKQKREPGRRLMSIEAVDEDYDKYSEDMGSEESGENMHVYSSSDVGTSAVDVDRDGAMLKRKWNDIIGKIMHESTSKSSLIENRTESWLENFSDDDGSVLKQLHFYDADKYIRKVAKKIIQGRKIDDLENEKIDKFDSSEAPRGKILPVKRKLLQYRDKSMFRLRYRMTDSNQSGDDSANSRLKPVHENKVSRMTGQSSRRNEGRDFAISLSGRIHVEGGINGQPISISFDTSPKVSKINETLASTTNGTAKYANDTSIDASAPSNANILSSIFNIAPASKESENNQSSQKDDKNLSSIVSPPVRPVRDDVLGILEENRNNDFLNFTQAAVKIRKTRAVDPGTAKRNSKYHGDRSLGLEEFRNSQVDAGAEDRPASSVEDDYEYNDDSPAVSPERKSLEPERHFSVFDERGKLDGQRVRVIKIVPLNMEEPSSEFSPLKQDENVRLEAKVSRMTASQLPKMKDDNVPGNTVIPGKIKPAELPWPVQEHITEAHSVCSFPKDQASELNDVSPDGSVLTTNPSLTNTRGPAMNESENENTNSNCNFEPVPVVNVRIQEKPTNEVGFDQNFIAPLGPDDHPQAPCSNTDVTRPPTVVDDVSSCSQDNGGKQTENKNVITNPPVTTPCSESDKPDIQTRTTVSEDTQCETARPTEKPLTCANDRETSAITSSPDFVDKSETRKRIRMKNMLAILEFMKKINEIMSGDDETDFPSNDYHDAIIKLERVIIIPNNSDDSKMTTHSTVVIGEGLEQNPSCDQASLLQNSRPSVAKATINGIINFSHKDGSYQEAGALDSPLIDNKRFIEKNEDQSFLFDGKNEKFVNQASSSGDDLNRNRFFSALKPSEHVTNLIGKGEIDSSSHSSIAQTTHSSATSFGDTSDTESMIVIDPRGESGPAIPQKPERMTDDRVPDLRNEIPANHDGTNFGKKRRKMRYGSVNKRKAMSPGFAMSPMNQRHRSINHLPSNRESYVFHDQSYAGGQIDRSKSSNEMADRISDETFGKLAAVTDTSREKRKRKKKRRRKKKRKKKRKKGKNGDRAMTSRKSWWPFKRQLMSFNLKRFVLESNFDLGRTERTKMKKRNSHRSPLSLKQRKIRKAHLYDYRHKKKNTNKKRPKYKKRKEKNMKKRRKSRKDAASGRNKRQINPGGTQIRGGQDCMDRRHPANTDPVKYLESAHCLRFSDLWYSVYELENPMMEHTVYMQLYEKHSLADGTTHWDDLTQGTMVRMGTFTRRQRDDKPTIVFTYSGARMEPQNRALNLDPTRQRLLVPSPVPPNKASQYSAVRGPGEYLVVQANAISKDGKECDKAGVSFAAFAKQDDRCGRTRGSCLKNQPLTYWRHDMEARDSGRPGCYFLSNFATVPTNPIKYNVSGTGSREYLGLEYHSPHVSVIDIEVRTDYNAIVRVGSSGRVTEVYVDSTSLEHTVVTVVISNMGLASSPYQPRIADCPTGLPISWSKAKGIMQIIPPQHDQRVTLDLYGQLLLNGFHCTVELVNHRGELVAMRRIRVQKMDRCFCVWQCLCACIGSVSGLGCQPMSLEHYHAAGFQGPVPATTTETSILMDTVKDVLMLSALLVLLLLFLGLLKWFVGLFAYSVGRWGLEILLDGSEIESDLEGELRCRCVVTDDDGVPVHPDTGQRTARICSRKLEFGLNLIFFLVYPIAICRRQFGKSSRQHRCRPDDSKTRLLNEKSSCPKLICVSTYGDSRNSKLEAEDTRYVMNELKKSQESLQNPKGTKTGLRARKRDT